MIQIKTFYFNDLRTCCYLLWDETKECVIVDPGCFSESEKNRLVKFVNENELKPVKLVNTHGHFDHVMGNVFVSGQWNLETWMNRNDIPQLARTSTYGNYFGYEIPQPSEEVHSLEDGDRLTFGDSYLEVRHTPGHSRGGIVLYSPEGEFVLVVAGAEPEVEEAPTEDDAAGYLKKLIDSGMSRKDAIKQTAKALDLPKNVVYDAALNIDE